MKLTLGSDPEMHLFDKEEGRIVSALRVLNRRDKNRPIDLGDGIKMYADNVLVEASFPPVSSVAEFIAQLYTVLDRMQTTLTDRYAITPKAAIMYEKSELRGKKPWAAGCNPNFDVYGGSANPPAKFTDGLRTGSFHLHVGHPKAEGKHMPPKEEIVKLMDVFVGCSSVIFDKDETSPLRRALYGRAGEFRPTDYGVEYRVLGNWPLRSPVTTQLVWDLALHAVHHFDIGDAKPIIEAVGHNRVQLAINNNDRSLARQVLEVAALPWKLMERVNANYGDPIFSKEWGL